MELNRLVLILGDDGGRFIDWMLDFVSTLEVDIPTDSDAVLRLHLTPFWRMSIDSHHFDIHVLGCGSSMTDLVCREDLSQDGWCRVHWDTGATYGTDDVLTDHRNGLTGKFHGKHGLMRFEIVQFAKNCYEVGATCGHQAVLPTFLSILRAIAKRWPQTEGDVSSFCSRRCQMGDLHDLSQLDIVLRSEWFRAIFATIVELLETYCTGYLLVPDDVVDLQYIRGRQRLEDILATSGMDELRPLPEYLPESLYFLDVSALDVGWEHYIGPDLNVYKGRIHEFCVRVERDCPRVVDIETATKLLGESAESVREKLGDESAESVPYPAFVRMLVKQKMKGAAQFVEGYRSHKAKVTRDWLAPVEKSTDESRPRHTKSAEEGTAPCLEERQQGGVTGKPSKPQEPPEGAPREAWFRYYYDMKASGYKYTHRETAEKLRYTVGTIRQMYLKWLAEHPELKERTNIS